MGDREKDPLREYKDAFIKFSDADESEFLIKRESGALVSYEGLTYRVCHYDDLIAGLKSYFDDSPTSIYIETPFDLWRHMYETRLPSSTEDFIIDLYKAWDFYWDKERNLFYKKKDFEISKDRSLDLFKKLAEKFKSSPEGLIQQAIEIEDITFIPIIALALRNQYDDHLQFYKKCLNQLIENFPHTFGDDGNFDEVRIMKADGGLEWYYIYQPDYKFDDVDFGLML